MPIKDSYRNRIHINISFSSIIALLIWILNLKVKRRSKNKTVEFEGMERRAAEERYKRCHIQILPREMVMGILSRLPIYSLFQCTLVSKEWRDIVARDSHFATMQHNRALKNKNNILSRLVFTNHGILYLVERGGTKHRKLTVMHAVLRIPYLGYHIVGSCNGLFCFFVWVSESYVCNPITREIVWLPSLPSALVLNANASGFGFDSATNKYKVVQVFEEDHFRLKAKIYTLGTEAWREVENVPKAFDEFSYEMSDVLVNGCLHWCGHKIIMSLDMGKEQFGTVPAPPNLGDASAHTKVMAWKGHVSFIYYYYRESYQIWVMKEYNVKESWTPLFNVRWPTCLSGCFSTDRWSLPLFFKEESELEDLELDVLIKNLCSRDPYFLESKAVTHIGSLVSLKTITRKVNEMKFMSS